MINDNLSRWRNWLHLRPPVAATRHSGPPLVGPVIKSLSQRTEQKDVNREIAGQKRDIENSKPLNRDKNVASSACERYMLWIDGVGAWQMCIGHEFLIGGPTMEHSAADICLMANLSRRHATLQRNAEDWFIQPHQSTVVSGRSVAGPTLLRTGDAICLAERVRLGFRIPNVLSGSAVIDFESHHRPAHSVNGIILMTDSVLLGPRKDYHICCPDWPDMVVLYQQDGFLKCRSRTSLFVNGERVRDSMVLNDGAIVSGEEFRFRIEKQSPNQSV